MILNLDQIEASPCVGSGMCCKTANCGFGEWNAAKRRCQFLEVSRIVDGVAIYRCGRYADIVGQPTADISPAFGAGCCGSLGNTNRNRILGLIAEGRIDRPYGATPFPTERSDE